MATSKSQSTSRLLRLLLLLLLLPLLKIKLGRRPRPISLTIVAHREHVLRGLLALRCRRADLNLGRELILLCQLRLLLNVPSLHGLLDILLIRIVICLVISIHPIHGHPRAHGRGGSISSGLHLELCELLLKLLNLLGSRQLLLELTKIHVMCNHLSITIRIIFVGLPVTDVNGR